MSREEEQYVCALSGLTSDPSPEDECDGLGDLPIGWTRITITRRQLNPAWVELQQAKERIIEAFLEQIPQELRDMQRRLFEIQVAAQFYGLEATVDKYLPDVEDTLDCADDPEVEDVLNGIREQLGLDPMPELDDDPEEDED